MRSVVLRDGAVLTIFGMITGRVGVGVFGMLLFPAQTAYARFQTDLLTSKISSKEMN